MESSNNTSSYCSKAFVRKPAPAFEGTVWDGKEFKNTKLSDYKGKWVVLFFYPLDFTFVCPTEICNFSDANETFSKIGKFLNYFLIFLDAQIIGCSTDSHFSHRQWALQPRKQGGLAPCNIPLLSDMTHTISKDYGVYIDHGNDNGVAFRATFIIDPKGILRQYSVNDLPVGRSVDEVLRLLQAFQHADKYGEVCPARWKPGKPTMVPELGNTKTEDYFNKEHVNNYNSEQK